MKCYLCKNISGFGKTTLMGQHRSNSISSPDVSKYIIQVKKIIRYQRGTYLVKSGFLLPDSHIFLQSKFNTKCTVLYIGKRRYATF